MGCSTFCGILTIQVGVTVLAAVFLTLGAVVLVVNIFEMLGADSQNNQVKDEVADKEKGPNWVLIMVVANTIILFAIGGLSFYSAYNQSRGLALAALLTLILFTTLWITLSVLSFIGTTSTIQTVCYRLRCPETLWLANLNFRKYYSSRNVSARNFKDNMDDNLISESIYESSRLSFEIQQALDELEKFSLCLKPCYKEECSLNKEEETYNCNLNSLLNIIKRTHIIKGLAELIIPGKEVLKNSINESVNSLFYAINNNETHTLSNQNDDEENTSTRRLPQYNVLTTFKYGKELLNNTKEVIKEKIYITKLPKVDLNKTYWSELIERGNKEAKDKVPSKLLTESKLIENKYRSLLNEEFSIKEAKKDEEESNNTHELPFTAALCLFIANALFFIFTAIILWSWIQELTYFDDCDEILYYY